MMSKQKEMTGKRVIELIKENVELFEDAPELTIDTEFASLQITSIDFIKVIVAVEAEYGFEIEDDDLSYSNFKTVSNMVDYIVSNYDKAGDE